LTLAEFQQATLEISVLSSLERITGAEEVTIGEHGLLLEIGTHRGLLLPQVAVEYGWDALTFLDALCRKAGLPKGAWQDPSASLAVFTAEIFRSAKEVANA
jgi:uncharacterized protein (TIGR00296 family)